MNKIRGQVIGILAVIAAVFSAVAFFVPFEKEAVFWIAYIAELLAVIIQVPVFKLAYPVGSELRSKVIGYPIFKVGITYLSVQTILSLALFILGNSGDFPVWLAGLLCTAVFGIAVIFGISANMAREAISNMETVMSTDTRLMKSLALRAQNLVNKTGDPELKKELDKLAEKITYSDPVSSPAIAESEHKLAELFGQLEAAVVQGQGLDVCKAVNNALDDRNAACKAAK